MQKGRLEAFSDGVLAIIITIMVLEIKVPHEVSLEALIRLVPVFVSYIISFLYVGIYWNNHHHLFQSVKKVDGRVLWANMFLLFCLSLIPFASGWMGENHFQSLTVVLYGSILFLSAMAYYFLTLSLLKNHSIDSTIHKALGNKFKERASLIGYTVGLVLSVWVPLVAIGIYTLIALIWLYPDRRIEKELLDSKLN